MNEANETPKPADVAGRLDGLVGRGVMDYHCATHGWWNAARESGCPECVVFLRRENRELKRQIALIVECVPAQAFNTAAAFNYEVADKVRSRIEAELVAILPHDAERIKG